MSQMAMSEAGKSQVARGLNVRLSLDAADAGSCNAIVTVTMTDTGYRAGELRRGLPPGMEGFPDVEYLTFYFRHEDQLCGELLCDATRSLAISISDEKRDVVACAVVNGKLAGHASAPVLAPQGREFA